VVTSANDVAVAVAVLEETVRADTVVVTPARRRVVLQANSLPLSVVGSAVDVVLLPAPRCFSHHDPTRLA